MKRNHIKQIPTTFEAIRTQLFIDDMFILDTLIKCITRGGGDEYDQLLIIVSFCLERLSRMVYWDGDGAFVKPPAAEYKTTLFGAFGETIEEVGERAGAGVDGHDVKKIHFILWKIADIVAPMMACGDEQAFVSEYAYAIDFVIKNAYNIPKPEMRGLFPVNYDGFNPSKFVSKLPCNFER